MGNIDTVIQAAENAIGWPYVYGAWGGLCTPSLRRKYLSYNPDHTAIQKNCPVLSGKQSGCAGCKYEGSRAFDCRGFTYWVLQQVGITLSGGGATSQYNTNSNWVAKGEISEMPNVVCCVFQRKSGSSTMLHTGLHVGDGKIIHCSGEVKVGSVADKGWTHYAIPVGLYTDDELKEREGLPMVLKKNSSGQAVKELQTLLNMAGYDCGKIDGKFGTKTQAAVEAFQEKNGFTVDGIATEEIVAALKALLNNDVAEPAEEQEATATAETVCIELPVDVAETLYAALAARLGG